jgi:DNA-binding transcriptional ArsR family regulator
MEKSFINHQWMQIQKSKDDSFETNSIPPVDDIDKSPNISWDIGTAYDLFISLYVLHHPEMFGLRPLWAAGVRSRLTSEERQTLEIAQDVFFIPFHWIATLPKNKDGESVLWGLKQLDPAERLPALGFFHQLPVDLMDLLKDVAVRGRWTSKDQEAFKEIYRNESHETIRNKSLIKVLDAWAHAEEFGEAYLKALQSYQEAFFAEEERQIRSTLEEGLEKAQSLVSNFSVNEMIENLTQGVQIQELLSQDELIFIPSYWSTPLVFYRKLDNRKTVVTFGVRPSDVSLVPGEIVPDALLQALKALADPTRLRIMRYLVIEPLSPAQLSRRLRLRPPTVTHHLAALRLAGLVHLNLEPEGERLYSARLETVFGLADQVQDFIGIQKD